jgi:hypothetical protein
MNICTRRRRKRRMARGASSNGERKTRTKKKKTITTNDTAATAKVRRTMTMAKKVSPPAAIRLREDNNCRVVCWEFRVQRRPFDCAECRENGGGELELVAEAATHASFPPSRNTGSQGSPLGANQWWRDTTPPSYGPKEARGYGPEARCSYARLAAETKNETPLQVSCTCTLREA